MERLLLQGCFLSACLEAINPYYEVLSYLVIRSIIPLLYLSYVYSKTMYLYDIFCVVSIEVIPTNSSSWEKI